MGSTRAGRPESSRRVHCPGEPHGGKTNGKQDQGSGGTSARPAQPGQAGAVGGYKGACCFRHPVCCCLPGAKRRRAHCPPSASFPAVAVSGPQAHASFTGSPRGWEIVYLIPPLSFLTQLLQYQSTAYRDLTSTGQLHEYLTQLTSALLAYTANGPDLPVANTFVMGNYRWKNGNGCMKHPLSCTVLPSPAGLGEHPCSPSS